jgi:hypothetical protein
MEKKIEPNSSKRKVSLEQRIENHGRKSKPKYYRNEQY